MSIVERAMERAKQAKRYALLEIQLERRLLAPDDPLALRNLLARACEIAAAVCAQPGAVPARPKPFPPTAAC